MIGTKPKKILKSNTGFNKSKMPLVSILIVNYNGRGLIINCLKALEEQSFKDFEIIIIDNASTDNSLDEIKNYLQGCPLSSSVKLIPLDENVGFSGGSLEGLRRAEDEYVALLNNDAEPHKRWLAELVKAMDLDSESGICASKMIVHGTDVIDSAGDGFSTALKGFGEGEGQKSFLYNEKRYVFGACGGAALYRRKMLEEIGFFDEDFFLIHEDIDLDFRAQMNGWKVLYVPTAIVSHRVRSSIGHMSDVAVYYTLRNSEFVKIKNIPLVIFIRCFAEFIIGNLTEFIYFAIKHKHLRLYFKAKIDAIKMLPRMLRKRAAIMKDRKVSNRYLLSIMTPVWQKDFLKTKIQKFLHA
jgi:GT2 family glycosyltransferase